MEGAREMRFIAANNPPAELIQWIAEQRGAGANLHYDNLGRVVMDGDERDVKEAIKAQRLRDQGFLCAYTMLGIEQGTAHVEHIVPRSVSNQQGNGEQTVDYGNLVACFPFDGGDVSYGFGAPVRGTQPLAVHPRQSNCQSQFLFLDDGRVESAHPGNQSIQPLIDDVLKLNAAFLISRRLAAYRGAGVGVDTKNPLRRAQAVRLEQEVCDHTFGGRLTEFCVGIASAARSHIRRLDKLAAKRRFARAQQQRP